MEHTLKNQQFNIILADDDADDRYFFKKALEELPITSTLKTVPDGEHLMNYLTEHTDSLPDVLFLDINMPCKNGVECLKEINQSEQLKQIPVVICSTSLGDDMANTLYHAGAFYYLHKCDFSDLKRYLQKILLSLSDSPRHQPPRNQFKINIKEYS